MNIKNLIIRLPILPTPDKTAREAADLMRVHGVTALPVTENQTLTGIVTDRQILSCCAAADACPDFCINTIPSLYDTELSKIQLREIMSRNPVCIPTDPERLPDPGLVLEQDLPFIPVVDRSSRVTGMVRKEDLLLKISRETAWEALSPGQPLE